MRDAYGPKHAVRFFGRHRLGAAAPVLYGLVTEAYGDGTIDVVCVNPVRRGTRFYDDVSSDGDPARDNVPLSSCPPPFSSVCTESAAEVLKDGHGQCYAVADMSNAMNGPRSRFTPVESEYEVSDADFELVLHHARNRKLERDGSGELRKASSAGTGRRRLGHAAPEDDGLDVQDGDVPVGFGSGTALGGTLSRKARERDHAKAAKEGVLSDHGDVEWLERSKPDVAGKPAPGKDGFEYE